MALRPRKVHPQFLVTPQDSSDKQRDQFEDLNQWYATLHRPPVTWGSHEVATWAWMPGEHGGAGLPWLAAQLHEACIDGHLLLQLTEQQLRHSVLPSRSDHDVKTLVQAVAELRRMADGIAAGQVLVPVLVTPPQPPAPSTRQILLQGDLPPKRKKKLPWDRDCCDQAQNAAASVGDAVFSASQGAKPAGLGAGNVLPTGLGYEVHTTVLPVSGVQGQHGAQQHAAMQPAAASSSAAQNMQHQQPGHVSSSSASASSQCHEVAVGPVALPVACSTQATTQAATSYADVQGAVQQPAVVLQAEAGDASNRKHGRGHKPVGHPPGLVTAALHATPAGRKVRLSQKEALLAAAAAAAHACGTRHVHHKQQGRPSSPQTLDKPCVRGSKAGAISLKLASSIPSPPVSENNKGSADSRATADSHATIGSTVCRPHDVQAGLDTASRVGHGEPHRPQHLRHAASPRIQSTRQAPGSSPPSPSNDASCNHTTSMHCEDAHGKGCSSPHPTSSTLRGQHRQRLLPAVAAHEQQAPHGPYHRLARPCPSPDIYGTRDLHRVRQVLAKGRNVPVQHTLKSALSEDAVRAGHKLLPRTPGFVESEHAMHRMQAADKEVALRLAQGIPVTRALYLATLETGALTRQIVQEKTSATKCNTHPAACANQQTSRPASAPQNAGPRSAQSHPTIESSSAAAQACAHASTHHKTPAVSHALDVAVAPLYKVAEWPPKLAWAAEKPAWIQQAVEPEYPIAGYAPTVAGGPMTKSYARQLARHTHSHATCRPSSPAGKHAQKPQRIRSPQCTCKQPCTCNLVKSQAQGGMHAGPRTSNIVRPPWSARSSPGRRAAKHASTCDEAGRASKPARGFSSHNKSARASPPYKSVNGSPSSDPHVDMASAARMSELLNVLRDGSIKEADIMHVMHGLGLHINDQDHHGMTLLHHVAASQHRHAAWHGKAMRLLLRWGSDPNITDVSHRTPLHLLLDDVVEAVTLTAANRIRHPKLATGDVWPPTQMRGLHQSVQLLLAAGANALSADCHGVTPVHMAAATGACSLVSMLLGHVKHQDDECLPADKQGRTPLHVAQAYHHKEVMALLTPLPYDKREKAEQPHKAGLGQPAVAEVSRPAKTNTGPSQAGSKPSNGVPAAVQHSPSSPSMDVRRCMPLDTQHASAVASEAHGYQGVGISAGLATAVYTADASGCQHAAVNDAQNNAAHATAALQDTTVLDATQVTAATCKAQKAAIGEIGVKDDPTVDVSKHANQAAASIQSAAPKGGKARLAQEQLAQLQQQLPQYVIQSTDNRPVDK